MLNLNFKIMKKVFLLLSSCLLGLAASATNYDIKLGSCSLGAQEQGAQAIVDVTSQIGKDVVLASGDVINVSIKGTFSAELAEVGVWIVDGSEAAGWWKEISSKEDKATLGSTTVETSASIAITADAVAAGRIQLVVFTSEATEDVSFTEAGVVSESYELTVSSDVTLSVNAGEDGYQGEYLIGDVWGEKLLKSGDEVTINIKGSVSPIVEGSIVLILVDGSEAAGWWNPLIGWGSTTATIGADGSIDASTKVTLSADAMDFSAYKLIFSYQKNDKTLIDGVESIAFTQGGSSQGGEGGEGGEPTAVESVSADAFAVVGGMVYSAGEITVYNVAGKAIATASQSFNVNSLEAGVYFISAQEGTIKFVK